MGDSEPDHDVKQHQCHNAEPNVDKNGLQDVWVHSLIIPQGGVPRPPDNVARGLYHAGEQEIPSRASREGALTLDRGHGVVSVMPLS